MERGNFIHAVQGLYYDVQVLDEEADVFAFPCVPERIGAFLVIWLFGYGQAFIQDQVQIGHCEIGVGLEELVGGIEGPFVVIGDLMVQFTLVIECPYVVARSQTVTEDLNFLTSRKVSPGFLGFIRAKYCWARCLGIFGLLGFYVPVVASPGHPSTA